MKVHHWRWVSGFALHVFSSFSIQGQTDTAAGHGVLGILQNTHGEIGIGLTYGSRPFTLNGKNSFHPYLTGDVSLTVLDIPIRTKVDLRSNIQTRGHAQPFQISVDVPAYRKRVQSRNAQKSLQIQKELDSLRYRRAELIRQLPRGGSETTIPRSPTFTDTLSTPSQRRDVPIDTIAVPSGSPPVINHDSLWTGSVNFPDTSPNSARLEAEVIAVDMMLSDLERLKERNRINTVNGINGKPRLNLLDHVERLEVGKLNPVSSQFLMNGLNIQGAGIELRNDKFFFSIDHGRSFDDVWRSSDPSAAELTSLREALFLSDPGDLSSRTITAFRIGTPSRNGLFVSLGFLKGLRSSSDLLYNAVKNHVVEVETGWRFRHDHTLTLTVARSNTSDDKEGEVKPFGFDEILESGDQDSDALDLRWRSNIKGTGTSVEIGSRTVDRDFQSWGTSFLRRDSRSFEARVMQKLGSRLNVGLHYKLESRAVLPGKNVLSIQRFRGNLSFKLTKTLTIRGLAIPVEVQDQNGMVNRTLVVQGGMDMRLTKKERFLLLHGEVSRYLWLQAENGEQHAAEYILMGLRSTGERIDYGVSGSLFLNEGGAVASLSTHLSWRSPKGTILTYTGSGDPTDISSGYYQFALNHPFRPRLNVQVTVERIGSPQLFINKEVGISNFGGYTCSLSLIWKW